jgi:hypothetical protein
MRFEFIDDVLDLPPFMITEDQVQGRGAQRVQQRREQAMHLGRVGLSSVARGRELTQVLRQLRMKAVFDHTHLERGLLTGCKVTR